MKKCPKCGETKSLEEFYHYKTGRRNGRPYSLCKTCHKVRTSTYLRETGKGRIDSWKQRGILLTVECYDEISRSQADRCAVCGREEPASGRRLAVDHNHLSGEIRGLLCTKCNTTLGWWEMHQNEFETYLKEADASHS